MPKESVVSNVNENALYIPDATIQETIKARNVTIGDATSLTIDEVRAKIQSKSDDDRIKFRIQVMEDNKFLAEDTKKETHPELTRIIVDLNKNFADIMEGSNAIVELLSKGEPVEETPKYATWNLSKILTFKIRPTLKQVQSDFFDKLRNQRYNEPDPNLPRMGPTYSYPYVVEPYLSATNGTVRLVAFSEEIYDVTTGGETVQAFISGTAAAGISSPFTDHSNGFYDTTFSTTLPGDFSVRVYYASWVPPTDFALSPLPFTAL